MTNPKFIKIKDKDCFSQDRFIYVINKKIDNSFIEFLKRFGEVTVFSDFAIPLIKMDVFGKFRLTCLLKSDQFNICFKEACPKRFIKNFEKELEKEL